MLRIILDAREYSALDPRDPGQYGASEPLVMRLAASLVKAGHRVDGIWDGDRELFIDGVLWWPRDRHPRECDVLIECEWLMHLHEFSFQRLLVPLNKINPILRGGEKKVDAFVVFSEEHKRELLLYTPDVRPDQIVIIGPGVEEPKGEVERLAHRLIWCNTPERGLVHLARTWPRLVERVPDASIVITYGLERSWQQNKWLMDNLAQELLEVRRWVAANPGSVLDAGRLSDVEMQRQQQQAALFAYPADAPLPGIVHCLAAMEVAAAGCALLLSNLEGLPEVFGEAADFLEIPIDHDQWAVAMADILLNKERRDAMGLKARAWAKRHRWSRWAREWRELVEEKNVRTVGTAVH